MQSAEDVVEIIGQECLGPFVYEYDEDRAVAIIRARDREIVEACRAAIAKGWDFGEPTLAYAKVQAILDSVYMSLA
jgi:hypothetical protein